MTGVTSPFLDHGGDGTESETARKHGSDSDKKLGSYLVAARLGCTTGNEEMQETSPRALKLAFAELESREGGGSDSYVSVPNGVGKSGHVF